MALFPVQLQSHLAFWKIELVASYKAIALYVLYGYWFSFQFKGFYSRKLEMKWTKKCANKTRITMEKIGMVRKTHKSLKKPLPNKNKNEDLTLSVMGGGRIAPPSTFSPVTPVILALLSPNLVTFPKNLFYVCCKNLKLIGQV